MDKIERGRVAQALLDNELLKEILNTLDGTYHAKWRVAATVEAREDLFRYVKVLEHLAADIRNIVTTGKLEEKRLAELEGRAAPVAMNAWKRGA